VWGCGLTPHACIRLGGFDEKLIEDVNCKVKKGLA